jgi:hypothetical protein
MKTVTATPMRAKLGTMVLPDLSPPPGKAQARTTSIVVKTTVDKKRQHAAIAKLVKICRASDVIANASRGITAEVRRDRDRGHG